MIRWASGAQGQPLTVQGLRIALDEVGADVPVTVEFYDGTTSRTLRPMHIDARGRDGSPTSVVLTVA